MIPVEGRVLPGLDEFMLRLGHLKVLCSVVASGGGSWHRINLQSAELLRAPVRVDFDTNAAVAEYLFRKRLCKTIARNSGKPNSSGDLRYPHIVVRQNDGTSFEFAEFLDNDSFSSIWWQDYCLASPDIPSTTGAITTEARSRSKTGFSHICDWAVSLDLIAKSGQLLPMGKLLATRIDFDEEPSADWNPYLLGPEIVVLAYAYLLQDMDIFCRLVPKATTAKQPLTRTACASLFVASLESAVADGEHARGLSAGALNRMFQQSRDLEKVGRRSHKAVETTSTAWHRAASRFETYVDLGLLDKARLGSEEKYKYVYYANDLTERVCAPLNSAASAMDWIDTYLCSTVFKGETEQDLDESDFLAILPEIVETLSLPTRLLPLDAVVLGIVTRAYGSGKPTSIGMARESVAQLARNRSDIAKLARGTRGTRAEYISLDIKKLGV